MKIGFFGNTNCYPFILAQACKELGHEVHFIVNKSERLHRPEFRFDQIKHPYPYWIYEGLLSSYKDYIWPNRMRKAVIEILRSCDATILNDLGPSLLQDIKRPSAALLTGSDLYVYASLNTPDEVAAQCQAFPVFVRKMIEKSIMKRVVERQRYGIQNAVGVGCYLAPGIDSGVDALFSGMKVHNQKRFYFAMTETTRLKLAPQVFNARLKIFCMTRHVWRQPLPPGHNQLDDKRSDIMIRGVAEYFKRTKQQIDLRLIRKGPDVEASMKLSKELGIEDQITWLDEMSQQAVHNEIRKSNLVIEQFGSTGFGMSALDAMALGRPVIMNARPDVFKPLFSTFPLLHASSPKEVSDHISYFNENRNEILRRGSECREFVISNFDSKKAAQKFLSFLQ